MNNCELLRKYKDYAVRELTDGVYKGLSRLDTLNLMDEKKKISYLFTVLHYYVTENGFYKFYINGFMVYLPDLINALKSVNVAVFPKVEEILDILESIVHLGPADKFYKEAYCACRYCNGAGRVHVVEEGLEDCYNCNGTGSVGVILDGPDGYICELRRYSDKYRELDEDAVLEVYEAAIINMLEVGISSESEKPKCEILHVLPSFNILGEDNLIFILISKVRNALADAGKHDKVKEFTARVHKSKGLNEALKVMMDYVEVY